MTHKRQGELKRPSINLDMADPEQVRVWEYWLELSERGEASKWARQALISALPGRNAQMIHTEYAIDAQPIHTPEPASAPSDFKSMGDDFLRKSSGQPLGKPLARPAPKPVIRSFDPDVDTP